MKRLALLAPVLGLVLVGCPAEKKAAPPAKAPPAPVKAASAPAKAASAPAAAAAAAPAGGNADVEAGKRLFMTACANCHGPDGSGELMRKMMPQIGNLTLPETHKKYDDAAFAELITKGRNKMPPFGNVFKPDQIKQIIAFARTLQKK